MTGACRPPKLRAITPNIGITSEDRKGWHSPDSRRPDSTPEYLNGVAPLSVATWHGHVDFCTGTVWHYLSHIGDVAFSVEEQGIAAFVRHASHLCVGKRIQKAVPQLSCPVFGQAVSFNSLNSLRELARSMHQVTQVWSGIARRH